MGCLKQVKLLSCDDQKKITIYFIIFLYIHDYAKVSCCSLELESTMLHYKNIKNVMYFHNEEFGK